MAKLNLNVNLLATVSKHFSHWQYYYLRHNPKVLAAMIDSTKDSIFFHSKESVNHPFAVVAVGKTANNDPTSYCRGIALCSLSEPFNRKIGIELALKRMLNAVQIQMSTDPIREDTCKQYHVIQVFNNHPLHNVMQEVHCELINRKAYTCTPIEYKSGFNIELSEFEQKMMNKTTTVNNSNLVVHELDDPKHIENREVLQQLN